MRSLRNNKAQVMVVVSGITIFFMGAVVWVALNGALEGTATSDGIFDVAENQLGVNATDPIHVTIKNGWKALPLGICVGGALLIVFGAIRRIPDEYYQGSRPV